MTKHTIGADSIREICMLELGCETRQPANRSEERHGSGWSAHISLTHTLGKGVRPPLENTGCQQETSPVGGTPAKDVGAPPLCAVLSRRYAAASRMQPSPDSTPLRKDILTGREVGWEGERNGRKGRTGAERETQKNRLKNRLKSVCACAGMCVSKCIEEEKGEREGSRKEAERRRRASVGVRTGRCFPPSPSC